MYMLACIFKKRIVENISDGDNQQCKMMLNKKFTASRECALAVD